MSLELLETGDAWRGKRREETVETVGLRRGAGATHVNVGVSADKLAGAARLRKEATLTLTSMAAKSSGRFQEAKGRIRVWVGTQSNASIPNQGGLGR